MFRFYFLLNKIYIFLGGGGELVDSIMEFDRFWWLCKSQYIKTMWNTLSHIIKLEDLFIEDLLSLFLSSFFFVLLILFFFLWWQLFLWNRNIFKIEISFYGDVKIWWWNFLIKNVVLVSLAYFFRGKKRR